MNPYLGGEVALPDRVERIVSLSPSLTDSVIRLGLVDRLVGRSAWCWRFGEIRDLPVVGSYTGVRRGLLRELEPDLILVTSGAQEALARELFRAGEPVHVVPVPSTPWGILSNLAAVAVAAGAADAAAGPLERLHDRLGGLRGVLGPQSVYVEIDLGGPVTIGPASYVYWALAWIGLRPLTPPGSSAWVQPPETWLSRLRPGVVILDPQPRKGATAETLRQRLVQRGLEGWLETEPSLVVTEGDVLAHHGPWLVEVGLPDLVARIGGNQDG